MYGYNDCGPAGESGPGEWPGKDLDVIDADDGKGFEILADPDDETGDAHILTNALLDVSEWC